LRSISADAWLALCVFACAVSLLLATLDQPATTWDEGLTILRESQMRRWCALVIDPPDGVDRIQLFREPAISLMWPFAREEPDGHPPFYAVIGNIGWWLGSGWLAPREAHRLGPATLFAVTCAVLYLFMARRFGRFAGFTAVGVWMLMPRFFAHAHLASYDVPLTCLWFLTIAAFWKAREGWHLSLIRGVSWSAIFALLLGCAAATKFTGWLIPIPLLAWTCFAGARALSRDGLACLPKLGRVLACLAIPVALAPVELMALREVRQTAANLPMVPRENSQARGKRAAEIVRMLPSTHPLNAAIYCGAGIWIAIYGWMVVRCIRSKGACSTTRHSNAVGVQTAKSQLRKNQGGQAKAVYPTAETWAAAALVPAVTLTLVPNWWHDPLRGIGIFLWSNLTRQATTWIPTHFFGTHYEFSLPWYNTLAWTVLTIPPLSLFLVVTGLLATCVGLRRSTSATAHAGTPPAHDNAVAHVNRGSLAWMLLLNAATLLVIRALPGSPGHDGERQLLGSFVFLACIAGIGAEWLRACLGKRLTLIAANSVVGCFVLLALIWSAAAIWHYRTAPLAYYTELIGGVRGAARLGLEPTYYWDALDQRTIDWLNANTRDGEKIRFCNYPESFRYLCEWGILRAEIRPDRPGSTRWYVLQNRPGLYLWNPPDGRGPADRWLAEHGRAEYVHELDGVPLIWVFPFDEYERATQQGRADQR
jgi:hypothetical protein